MPAHNNNKRRKGQKWGIGALLMIDTFNPCVVLQCRSVNIVEGGREIWYKVAPAFGFATADCDESKAQWVTESKLRDQPE